MQLVFKDHSVQEIHSPPFCTDALCFAATWSLLPANWNSQNLQLISASNQVTKSNLSFCQENKSVLMFFLSEDVKVCLKA